MNNQPAAVNWLVQVHIEEQSKGDIVPVKMGFGNALMIILFSTVEFDPHTSDPMDDLIVGNNDPMRSLIADYSRKIDNGNPK